MKSVFGNVYNEPILSESGAEIGAIFGMKSISNRIVLSPLLIGTTNTLLDVIGKAAVSMYFKE